MHKWRRGVGSEHFPFLNLNQLPNLYHSRRRIARKKFPINANCSNATKKPSMPTSCPPCSRPDSLIQQTHDSARKFSVVARRMPLDRRWTHYFLQPLRRIHSEGLSRIRRQKFPRFDCRTRPKIFRTPQPLKFFLQFSGGCDINSTVDSKFKNGKCLEPAPRRHLCKTFSKSKGARYINNYERFLKLK